MKKTEKHQEIYRTLHQQGRRARLLTGISHLLDWDQETYMPSGASGVRAEQLELLAGITYAEKTSKKFVTPLSKLIDIPKGTLIAKDLTPEQQAAVREWRHDYIKAKALPKKFVEEFARTTSQSILAWRSAKKEDNFTHFVPYLDKIIGMARKKADYLGYDQHPYDALLDEYEPGMTTADVSKLFGNLRTDIKGILKRISSQKEVDDSFLHGKFSAEKQMEFSKDLLRQLGYPEEHGRLDLSTHPFSLAPHPTDSRITTRIHPTLLLQSILAVLHEAGHAFYEMGLPQKEYGSPLGDYISLGMHESQSRWWETRIGQSKAFWQYALPLLNKKFDKKFDRISVDAFYQAVNKVEPSLIRIEADEVTYPLHIILRFELEKGLIEGSIKIRDIPEVWNAKMKELLGVTPSNNAEGCLQDIHWSMGAFGYFPTYTLGNLYASHLFEAFEKKYPDWEKRVSVGDFKFIREWLTQVVHRHGRLYSSQELLKKITGKKISADAYLKYLDDKYTTKKR